MSKPTNPNLFLVLAGPQVKIARLAVSFLPPQHLPSQKFLFKQWQLTQPSHRAGANVYPWPPFSALSHENMQNPFKSCWLHCLMRFWTPSTCTDPPHQNFPISRPCLDGGKPQEMMNWPIISWDLRRRKSLGFPSKNLGNVGNDWRTNHFVALVRLNAIVSGGRIEGDWCWDRVR